MMIFRISTHYNGAKKGIDSCYDRTWIIGYLIISYTNWNYAESKRNKRSKDDG